MSIACWCAARKFASWPNWLGCGIMEGAGWLFCCCQGAQLPDIGDGPKFMGPPMPMIGFIMGCIWLMG